MPVINASTSGPGGIQMGGDASGNLQLQSAGNTIATISSTGLSVPGGVGGTPAFSYYGNSNQGESSGVSTKEAVVLIVATSASVANLMNI